MKILSKCAALLLIASGIMSHSAISRVNTEEKLVALTFDDGPHPRMTEMILDVLEENDVRATFFVIGQNALYRPDIVKMTSESGHEIGNHTFSHPHISRLDEKSLCNEISEAEEAILRACGVRPRVFRPPEGACESSVMLVASKLEYNVILWSIDTRDWAHSQKYDIIKNVKKNIRPGSIILFHDYISGEAHTVEALKELIPYLKGEGYSFVTISELMAHRRER